MSAHCQRRRGVRHRGGSLDQTTQAMGLKRARKAGVQLAQTRPYMIRDGQGRIEIEPTMILACADWLIGCTIFGGGAVNWAAALALTATSILKSFGGPLLKK